MMVKVRIPLWVTGSVLVCIYRYLLDILYFEFISVHYAYRNFTDCRTMESFILSWFMVILSFAFVKQWLNKDKSNSSFNVLFFIYLISYIPFSTGVYAGLISNDCSFYGAVYYLLLFSSMFYCYDSSSRKMILQFDKITINRFVVCGCVLVFVLLIVGISLYYTGLRLNFSLSGDIVYALRCEARGYYLPTLVSYIFSMSVPFLSIMVGRYLIKRDFRLVLFFLLVLFLRFGIDAQKTVFFAPIAVFSIMTLCRCYSADIIRMRILLSFIGLALCGILECNVLTENVGMIENLFIRRVMFVPVQLHETYYQFFTSHEPDWFRGSFLRHFGFSSPYDSFGGIARTIGEEYLGNPGQNANNGLLSDGIANLGSAGVVIMPWMVVLVLKLFDKCTAGADYRITMASAFLLAWGLIGSSLGTLLLSHGMLLMMVTIMLMKWEVNEKHGAGEIGCHMQEYRSRWPL